MRLRVSALGGDINRIGREGAYAPQVRGAHMQGAGIQEAGWSEGLAAVECNRPLRPLGSPASRVPRPFRAARRFSSAFAALPCSLPHPWTFGDGFQTHLTPWKWAMTRGSLQAQQLAGTGGRPHNGPRSARESAVRDAQRSQSSVDRARLKLPP